MSARRKRQNDDADERSRLRAALLKPIQNVSFYAKPAANPVTSASSITHQSRWGQMLQAIREKTQRDNCFVVWRKFYKQEKAFRAQDLSPWPLRIFSYEFDLNHPGRRKFLVTTYEDFWTRYLTMQDDERVYYELIREEFPCKLYFDLEYPKDLNQDSDSEAMMKIFKKVVLRELFTKFKIHVEANEWIEMTSDTDKKFSRHVIVDLKNAVWKDNIHAGRFVSNVCGTIRTRVLHLSSKSELPHDDGTDNLTPEERQELTELLLLFIKTHEEKEVNLFVDEGVYTRNRNFRILFSTKLGKNAPLIQTHPKPSPDILSRKGLDAFLRTLVGAVGSWTPGMRVLAIDGSTTTSGGRGDDHVAKKVRVCTSGYMENGSPFPDIDEFLVAWVRENVPGGGNARVQRVAFFPDSITVTYAMVGTRYCYNIGKEHKSNGVYYVAEISHGIFSQRCHDPDCKYFRSREVEIPVELNPFKTENDTPPESSNGDGNNEATDDEDAPMGP